jgi:hypothetical protein
MSDPSDVRRKAQGLERGLGRRALLGYMVCSLLIWCFGRDAFIAPNLTYRIAACLLVASMLYLTYQVYRWRGRGIPVLGVSTPILTQFYRTELERQRNFHSGICVWSRVVSMIPGYILFCVGSASAHPKTQRIVAKIITARPHVEADILHTGDNFWNRDYPFIDHWTGGSIDGQIRAAEANIAKVTDKTIVIPGHGAVGNKADLFYSVTCWLRSAIRFAALKNRVSPCLKLSLPRLERDMTRYGARVPEPE